MCIEALAREPESFSHVLSAIRSGDEALISFLESVRRKSQRQPSGQKSRRESIELTQTCRGTALEFATHPRLRPMQVWVTGYPRADAIRFVQTLAAALKFVRQAAPMAFLMICRFTTRVEILRDIADPHFNSCSHYGFPRRTQLWNLHLAVDDICAIANALVHEAIHSFLYAIELKLPFIAGAPQMVRIKSPWSGNDPSMYSYIHACFVWFGLSHFWKRAKARDLRPEAGRYLKAAQRGFRKTKLDEPLLDFVEHVHIGVRRAIRMMMEGYAN